ncbi:MULTISPECIES: acyltransferase family protein [unclassified Rhizobium]|uniref:acyltransferase family protein n=1 Tax=unclassified Rhizobium TaxID=2613769 RepID=UPI000EAA2FE5|nr:MULTISPECIES: acyltransferase family protein [unclassified Rhizobium]AYG69791.1 acyltransferase [Rhizobium sp. CCGE531]AYG76166.1 acyltransferase [Rhizobium sp. CCGE532]
MNLVLRRSSSPAPVHGYGPNSLTYRRDIDGLRALAILPVVLYHAGIPGFSGGFVGVDVFFVISGFLMASLISNEIAGGEFSLVRFYERRIRRIFPALFAVLAASFIAAWWLLMPAEFAYFARSLKAAALFTSNIQFEKESGYFDIGAQMKPLLHTWSLAVEEQFYILFPLLLIVVTRFARRHATLILAGLLVVSFAASAWTLFHSQAEAFYLLQFRAWELLLGALLALGVLPMPKRPEMRAGLAAAGVLFIAIAIFGFSDKTLFPGPAALLPCLGAALIIHARDEWGPASRLLRSKPMVFVGLISYSLYLWHWPIIVFSREMTGRELSLPQGGMIVAASLAAAIISWRFIEQPFRGRGSLVKRVPLLAGAVTVVIAAAGVGDYVAHHGGLPDRLSADVRKVYASTYDQSRFSLPPCFADSDTTGPSEADIRAGKLCPLGPEGKPSFLVWGDSHSGAMAPAIDAAATQVGITGLFAGHASCPPLPGVQLSARGDTERCGKFNGAVRDLIVSQHVPLVFLVAYWPKYVHDAEMPNEGPYFDPSVLPPLKDRSASIVQTLDDLLADLTRQGTRVVLISDVPEMGRYMPEAVAKAMIQGTSTDLAPPLQYIEKRQALPHTILSRLAAKYGATIIDPLPSICSNGRCDAVRSGLPLYKDADHLAATFATTLSPLYVPALSELRRSVLGASDFID